MTTWIKVCGLTHADDALLAAALGADALGFVMHRHSGRFCEPGRVRSIVDGLPRGPRTVGVWLDERAEEVAETARFVGFDCLQTYEPSVAHRLWKLGFDVLPAVPAGDLRAWQSWRSFFDVWTGRMMLDASRSLRPSAATGRTFDLEQWRGMASKLGPARLVLAGGLQPDNVRRMLADWHPAGVDAASGIESSPGRKDPEKLSQFIEEVRSWDAAVASGNSADGSFRKRSSRRWTSWNGSDARC